MSCRSFPFLPRPSPDCLYYRDDVDLKLNLVIGANGDTSLKRFSFFYSKPSDDFINLDL